MEWQHLAAAPLACAACGGHADRSLLRRTLVLHGDRARHLDDLEWLELAAAPDLVGQHRDKCVLHQLGQLHGGRPGSLVTMRWNGRTWRSLHTQPAPSSTSDDQLTGISCTSRTRCLAIGSYKDQTHASASTAEQWNGKTWKVLTVPGHGGPRDLSCASAASCVAAGDYTSHHAVFNVAARWTGKGWRAAPTPRPGGLVAVSCTSTATCVAVGQASSLTLASRWNGTRWQLLRTVNP